MVVVVIAVIGAAAFLVSTPPAPEKTTTAPTTTTTPTATAPTTTTTPTTTPSGEPIKIGCIFNLTGVNAAYGYTNKKIVGVLEQKINSEGGIAGRPVKFFIEDDECTPSVGAEKFRKLVDVYNVDFVIGPVWSATDLACIPIAKETNTVYWPFGSSTAITGESGNRYVFRMSTSVREECKAATSFAIKELGKKWVTVVADFAFGWSYEQDFKQYIEEKGGQVLAQIRVPTGTADFLPYLAGKIPPETEAIQVTMPGGMTVQCLNGLQVVAPGIPKLGSCYLLTGIDPAQLGAAGENLYIITSYPERLEGLETPYNIQFRQLIGANADGKDEAGNWLGLPYGWACWESVYAIKEAVEKSGWKTKADNPKLIKVLEGIKFDESLQHPQGSKYIRAQDHQCFTIVYIEKVVNGKTVVFAKVPLEDAVYPPIADYTTQPLS